MSLRIDVVSVGAAFQPRLNDYSVRVTYFRGGKATPTKNYCQVNAIEARVIHRRRTGFPPSREGQLGVSARHSREGGNPVISCQIRFTRTY
jgi:hypothetical protein